MGKTIFSILAFIAKNCPSYHWYDMFAMHNFEDL